MAPAATGTMSVVVDPMSIKSAVPRSFASSAAVACQFAEAMSSTWRTAACGAMKPARPA
jgi:hypothetical protein